MAITCKKTSAPDTACVCKLATKAERAAMSGQTDPKKCTAAIEADASKFAVIGGASTNGDAIAQLKRGVVARPPASGAATPKDVLKKIDAAQSAADFSNISDNELKLITDDEIAKMSDVERKILLKLPNSGGESARIAATLASVGKSQSSILGDHSGAFFEAGCGLALSTATYSDSVTDADSIASANAIKTGALGAGDSPSGAFPGGRCGATLGYAISAAKDLNIRFGIYGRLSGIKQGYENPQFGRSVSPLTQLSGMAFIGVEKYFTPEFSAFLDGRLGFTNNTFDNNADNLQTSAQANQYAKLSQLEGSVLSGGAQAGVAYRLFGYISAFAALDVYTDATKASAETAGGGAMDFGLKGAEVTATIGLRVSK